MKTALYLDDQRTPTKTIPGYKPWDVVRNYTEFTEYIEKHGIPDLVSFDHDLADEHIEDYFKQKLHIGWQQPDYNNYKEKTGLDCAMWMCNYAINNNQEIKQCSVHSHNPIGAVNIQSYINGFKKHMGWIQDCYIGKHEFIVEKETGKK